MAQSDDLGAAIEMSFKKKAAVSRNWMVVDSCGEGMIVDWDKFDIMRRLPINGRDLRILDPLLSYPSAILVRERAIVLNLEVVSICFLLCGHFYFAIYSFLLLFVAYQGYYYGRWGEFGRPDCSLIFMQILICVWVWIFQVERECVCLPLGVIGFLGKS